jgi:tight adherence protein B
LKLPALPEVREKQITQNSVSKSNVAKRLSAANSVRQISALVAAGIPAQQARHMCQEQIETLSNWELKQFELVWKLATTLGGPVIIALSRIAAVFDRQQRNRNEVELAFAGPQSTSKLVTGLPLIALALAQLVGMNPLAAITGSPLGLISVCLGAGLLVLGRQWSRRLLTKALPQNLDPGAYLDCVLIGLQAGLPLQVSRERAAEMYWEFYELEPSALDQTALNQAAELSRNSGAALSEILLTTADRFRDELSFEISNRIARLGIKLMIPLGVAVLPAFILISIVPIAISLLSKGQL